MSYRLRIGDIAELPMAGGVAYVSYAGKHSRLGPAIWVIPRTFPSPTRDWEFVFQAFGYHTFYRLSLALHRKLAAKVGHALIAVHPVPKTVRQRRTLDMQAPDPLWYITDEPVGVNHRDSELTPEQRAVPQASLWNHPTLVERIQQGWMP